MTTQQTVKIQLVRSPIGTKESHRATVRGLGLRKLNSSSFHLERFIVNACMYLACDNENEKDVYNLMYPQPNKSVKLKDFFWEHIQKDLKLAGKSLNLNLDELIILLHKAIFSFLTTQVNFSSQIFSTKEDRQNWEDFFNKNHLLPTFNNTVYVL